MVDGTACADYGQRDEALRVLVVDDHAVLRVGLRQVLETSDDIVVVGEADDGNSALAMIDCLDVTVALVDVQLPDQSGIDVARQLAITHPGIRVIIFSGRADDASVRAAFKAGVTGYLLKTMPRQELINAVRTAGQGIMVLDPLLPAGLATLHGPSTPLTESGLTSREREIVDLVADGLSNRAIAHRLGVSVRTVEGHLSHSFAKLDIESRTALVRLVLADERASTDQSSELGP